MSKIHGAAMGALLAFNTIGGTALLAVVRLWGMAATLGVITAVMWYVLLVDSKRKYPGICFYRRTTALLTFQRMTALARDH